MNGTTSASHSLPHPWIDRPSCYRMALHGTTNLEREKRATPTLSQIWSVPSSTGWASQTPSNLRLIDDSLYEDASMMATSRASTAAANVTATTTRREVTMNRAMVSVVRSRFCLAALDGFFLWMRVEERPRNRDRPRLRGCYRFMVLASNCLSLYRRLWWENSCGDVFPWVPLLRAMGSP
jgi:hypothetical protein